MWTLVVSVKKALRRSHIAIDKAVSLELSLGL
jgi:hypothetical protein